MNKTQKLLVGKQWLRMSGKEASTYPFPKRIWYIDTARNITRPILGKLIDRVPVNTSLVDNLRNEIVRNPILLGHDGWVWVGSQRLRALHWLYDNEGIERELLVCRFTENNLRLWALWGGDEAKRCAAIQIQLQEILFKSMFYGVDKTDENKDMIDYEVEGNAMHWKVRDEDPFWKKESGDIK